MVDCQRDLDLEMERTAHRAIFGNVVGRQLDGPTGSYGPWCVCHIDYGHSKRVRHIAFVRECSSKESYALNMRLAAAQIVLRYTKPHEGEPWALAYD